ncbi:MAG: sugar ABC transporter substrate-binding protein, partial [Mesorhizobium sp.]
MSKTEWRRTWLWLVARNINREEKVTAFVLKINRFTMALG